MRSISAFWWVARPNWGDGLTPILLERLAGLRAVWASPAEAEIVCVGSVLDLLPDGWSGIVLGAGKLHERTALGERLRNADIRLLRGSGSVTGRFPVPLGDPALLMSEIVQQPARKRFDLVVVPHWSDHSGTLARRYAHLSPHVIDPGGDPLDVVGQIAAARKVVSASLHGLIVADAYRIPRRAERFPKIDHPWEGGEFKYHDYSSAVGERMQFGQLHTPNPAAVDRAQSAVFDAFRSLA